jgi:hypothetical protein
MYIEAEYRCIEEEDRCKEEFCKGIEEKDK